MGSPAPTLENDLLRQEGLRYVSDGKPGYTRTKRGKGFSYRDGTGQTIRDKAVKARINQLAIPPAWRRVCIAADERAHIQDIGRDVEGRLQYRDHPEWDKARATAKGRQAANHRDRDGSLPRYRTTVQVSALDFCDGKSYYTQIRFKTSWPGTRA